MIMMLSFISKDKICGYVYDKKTNEYLCGVRIIVGVDTTYTNFDGYFEIKNSKIVENIKLSLISYDVNNLIYVDKQQVYNNMKK